MSNPATRDSGDQPTQDADKERGQSKQKTPAAMEEDVRGFNIVFGVTQAVGVLSVVLMLVWTSSYRGGFAWRSNPWAQFNWHPLLMTIGFIYLFGNSIMIYRALRGLRKQKLKLIHAGIHTAVILCVLIGQVAVFDFHGSQNIANLYTLHSWIGLIAIIIFVLQWLVSILIFLYPGAALSIRTMAMPWHVFLGLTTFVLYLAAALSGLLEKWLVSILIFLYPGAALSIRTMAMPWHVFLGLTTFVLSLAAALSGLLEKAIFSLEGSYQSLPGEGLLINFIGVFFALFGVLVVYLVTETKYKRYPRPEDGALLNTSAPN